MSEHATIRVGDDYPVVIGRGLLDQVGEYLPGNAVRVLVVHAPALREAAAHVSTALDNRGLTVVVRELPDAEAAKDITVAADLWATLGQEGFTRTDAVLTLGGGATTDLGGFVAASWLRGVPVVHLPSSLLAMVDAAVGGKTGVNTAEGKNLVGAFHSPAAVLCDLDLLDTLPRADLVAGSAEIIKCGFIADPTILALVEADPAAALDPHGPVLAELVQRAVQVKADVVAADLREASLREILNYGHTLGHAIEQLENYQWRHGDAVAVGMVFAAELAWRAGVLDESIVQRHRAVLTSVGLPTTYAAGRWDDLLTVMARDKKTRGNTLRFVALTDIAAPTRLEGPDTDWLRGAYDAISG